MLYYFYLAKLGGKSLYLARKASTKGQRFLLDNLAHSTELDYSRFYVEDITTLRKKYNYLAKYPVTKSTAGSMQAEWQLHFEMNNLNNDDKFLQKMNSGGAENFLYHEQDTQNGAEMESLDIASIFKNNPEIYHLYINILTILGVLEVLIASNQLSFASGYNLGGAGSSLLSFYSKYLEFNIFNTAPNYKPYFNSAYVTNISEDEDDYFCYTQREAGNSSNKNRNNSRQDNMPHDYPDNYWYYEDEIYYLIDRYLRDSNNTSKTKIIHGTHFQHKDILEANLNSAFDYTLKEGKTCLIPINNSNSHWMSLAMIGGRDNNIHVLFADSSGGKSIFDNIKGVLQQHDNGNIIYHNLSIKQQYNGYDCGPYTTENLKLFASINPAEKSDSEIQEKMLTGVLTETRQAHREHLYERDNGIDCDRSTNPSPGAKGGSNFDGDYNDYLWEHYFQDVRENINLSDEFNLDSADWYFSGALGDWGESELN